MCQINMRPPVLRPACLKIQVMNVIVRTSIEHMPPPLKTLCP